MTIQEAKVGMKVRFGRGNGQWTLGEIVKINPTKAKVKTLESRGHGRGSDVGAVWSVPYSMMTLTESALPVAGFGVAKSFYDPAGVPYPYNPLHEDNPIMEAIVRAYNGLSPESLTWDGEKPLHRVKADRKRLEAKLGHLFAALGRPVSESVAYGWSMESRKK